MRNAPLLVGTVIGCIVMAVVGYQVRGIMNNSTAAIPGWCCMEQGSACVRHESLSRCQAGGGLLFESSEPVCNSLCASVQ